LKIDYQVATLREERFRVLQKTGLFHCFRVFLDPMIPTLEAKTRTATSLSNERLDILETSVNRFPTCQRWHFRRAQISKHRFSVSIPVYGYFFETDS